jgi:fluoroacetyl-CoA thioesterase
VSDLRPGLRGSAKMVVGEEHTASRVGSGVIQVLATPVMINLMEAAALDAMEKHLPAGRQSLGTHLDVSHVAATPVGMRVVAKAEVLEVDGNKVTLRVEALDEAGLIDEGTHKRVVVDVARFDARVQDKVKWPGS